MDNFNNKIAVVTGGGTGMGRELCLQLVSEGCAVATCDVMMENLEETKKQCEQLAPDVKVTLHLCDVSSEDAMNQFRNEVIAAHGNAIHLLFNNAGIGAPAIPLEDLTVEQWKSVVDINLTGAFLCTQEAFRIMKEQNPQGGRIINNGSISAHVPRPFSSPYTATKHAITGLTRSSSLDGRAYNIACGQIDIGNAETDMTARMKKGVLQANGTTSTEPTIDPDHVAKALVYMAGLPLDANVQFMTVMATQMPFIGRG